MSLAVNYLFFVPSLSGIFCCGIPVGKNTTHSSVVNATSRKTVLRIFILNLNNSLKARLVSWGKCTYFPSATYSCFLLKAVTLAFNYTQIILVELAPTGTFLTYPNNASLASIHLYKIRWKTSHFFALSSSLFIPRF